MPIPASRISGNVYHSVDGRYTKFTSLDRQKLLDSSNHEIKIDDGMLTVVLDKDAPDYEDMFRSKGTKVPADEILDQSKPGALKLPMKTRDDFKPGEVQLPDSELLEVLHYFASKKLTSNPEPQLMKRFDEGALLALGLLVEQWVDEIIDESTVRLFTTRYNPKEEKSSRLEFDDIDSDDDLRSVNNKTQENLPGDFNDDDNGDYAGEVSSGESMDDSE